MGTLLISDAGSLRAIPLPSCALAGREWTCAARFSSRRVPRHWLELRWGGGGWTWRALAATEVTWGVGEALPDGWRRLPPSLAGRLSRIRLDAQTWVELVDGAPPVPFAVDLHTGETWQDDTLTARVGRVVHRDGAATWFALGDPARRPLVDGDVVLTSPPGETPRLARLHLPAEVAFTDRPPLQLTDAPLQIDIDLTDLRAQLTQGSLHVVLVGAEVRSLAVYAHARALGVPADGWLDLDGAYAAWRALGGPAESPRDRLTWERGKLRSQLADRGVAGAVQLFESRRMAHGAARTRLAVPVEGLTGLPE
jgi:hypothetical protein